MTNVNSTMPLVTGVTQNCILRQNQLREEEEKRQPHFPSLFIFLAIKCLGDQICVLSSL